ncbi:MAG: tyrosine-type recombinase/integrase [Rhodoferax sp.]|nr:tyrosine-type recombinase/integrase [Rhodoferax sp.]MCF8209248.1 tyrosine-type recombinase/integrase [Rhodoferax sp.]
MAPTSRALNYTLTDKKVNAAKPKDKPYPLADGGGLYLDIMPGGSKVWRYSYRVDGKRTKATIGAYPLIGIKEARDLHEKMRRQLLDQINPARQKQIERIERSAKLAQAETFESFARVWFAEKMATATARTQKQSLGWMVNDVFPKIGAIPLGELHARDVLKLLEGMRNTPTKANNIRSIIERIYQYAAQKLLVTVNPAEPMRGLIQKPKATSYRPLSVAEIGPFVEAVRTCNAHLGTRIALELLMLTAVRKDNVAKARWAHFDLAGRTWTIPGRTTGANGNMKMPEPHTVYLSDQALVLLEAAKQLSSGSEFVFPSIGRQSVPMAECTINHLLSRLKASGSCPADFAPHGLRSTFSTLANENGIAPDVIEVCLAHHERNAVRAAYNKAKYAAQCKDALQWYANRLDQIRKGADVILIRAAA